MKVKIEKKFVLRPVLERPPEYTIETYWLVTGDGLPEIGLLFETRAEAEAAAKLEWKGAGK